MLQPNLRFQPKFHSAIIFRQSKSWTEVENKLNEIAKDNLPTQCQEWVAKWQLTIRKIFVARKEIYRLSNIRLNPQNYEKICKTIEEQWEKIKKILDESIIDPQKLDNEIIQSTSTKNIADYIHNYWQHLRVFSEWHEVLLNEDRMNVNVISKDPLANYDELTNSSTKAIFIANEIDRISTKVQYFEEPNCKEPRIITKTNKIQLKLRHLAPSPHPRQPSSTIEDELSHEIKNTHKLMNLEQATQRAVRIANKIFENPCFVEIDEYDPPLRSLATFFE